MEDGRLRRGKVLGVPTDFVSCSSSSSSSSSSSRLRSLSTLSLTCRWCLSDRILSWLSLREGGAHASTSLAVVAGMPPALSFRLKEASRLSWSPVDDKEVAIDVFKTWRLFCNGMKKPWLKRVQLWIFVENHKKTYTCFFVLSSANTQCYSVEDLSIPCVWNSKLSTHPILDTTLSWISCIFPSNNRLKLFSKFIS